jgi:uncharacterized protein with NRDE domain
MLLMQSLAYLAAVFMAFFLYCHRNTPNDMCLILFAWQQHAQYKLVVAANRDEFYARPTAPAQFWHDTPQILAGRDLEQGGTWLGVTRSGRFAAITNVRDPSAKIGAHSRGHLGAQFSHQHTNTNRFHRTTARSPRWLQPFQPAVE